MVDHVPAGRTLPFYEKPQRGGLTNEDTRFLEVIWENVHDVSESYIGRVIHDLKRKGCLLTRTKFSFNARRERHHEKPRARRRGSAGK